MLKASLDNDGRFFIYISVEKFKSLWDDSYEDEYGYNIGGYSAELCIDSSVIDLDSFVADMIFSSLDDHGEECEDVNNEFFENCDAINCSISSCANGIMTISGKLVELEIGE
jgi:hypothetical protein